MIARGVMNRAVTSMARTGRTRRPRRSVRTISRALDAHRSWYEQMGPGISASLVVPGPTSLLSVRTRNQKAICMRDHDDDVGREINQRPPAHAADCGLPMVSDGAVTSMAGRGRTACRSRSVST
jgi:hypothetical protein